jgi:CPA2 family monovalent cation:H+ antiporter-2
LFSALFFLFFGFGIDPATIPGVLGAAVVLALVTATAKVATGVLGGRRLGLEAPRAWRAGVVLIPRGEFSIAIAGIAVVAGLEPRLAPLTATYVLLLAVAAPLIVAMLPNGRAASVDSVAEEEG